MIGRILFFSRRLLRAKIISPDATLRNPLSKKNSLFGGLFFDFFLEKIKKQAPKHHFISPPEAAKYFNVQVRHQYYSAQFIDR